MKIFSQSQTLVFKDLEANNFFFCLQDLTFGVSHYGAKLKAFLASR